MAFRVFLVMSMSSKFRSCLETLILFVLVACTIWAFSNSLIIALGTDEESRNQSAGSNVHHLHKLNETRLNDHEVLPISKGYVHGRVEYFVATDASSNDTAYSIFENTGWRVNFAPILAQIPNHTLSQGYEFLNGISGQGAFGFQLPVASSIPKDENYSPLVHLNLVRWNENATMRILKSAQEIILANQIGDLQIIPTNITINSPAVLW